MVKKLTAFAITQVTKQQFGIIIQAHGVRIFARILIFPLG